MVLITTILGVSVAILALWNLALKDKLRNLTNRLDEIEARQLVHRQVSCNECEEVIEMYNNGTISCGCATIGDDESSTPSFLDLERGYLKLWPFSGAVLGCARLIARAESLPSPPSGHRGRAEA
jgi:hypothetical protein